MFMLCIKLHNIILHEKKKVVNTVNTIRMEILALLKCLDCNNNTQAICWLNIQFIAVKNNFSI